VNKERQKKNVSLVALSRSMLDKQQTHLLAVDGLSTSAVVVGEVTTLEHELGNDTVEAVVGRCGMEMEVEDEERCR
jgi:hypothetical protein